MSMYHFVFPDPQREQRIQLLAMIRELTYVPRIRDAWVEKGEDGSPVIVFYTRIGGGNRADYADHIRDMQAHEGYLRDRDDNFDSTYATFYYRTPEEWVEALSQPEVMQDPVDTDARWLAGIAALDRTAPCSTRPSEGLVLPRNQRKELT